MINIDSYLKRYRNSGDKKWFEKIYYHYMPKIYRFYYFKLSNKQLAEDLTSELFLKAYKGLRKTSLNSKAFNVWIYKIANNLLIDYFRKTGKADEFNLSPEEINNLIQYSSSESGYSNISESDFENHKLILAISKLTKL